MIEGNDSRKDARRHIVGMLVEDQPGVMAKISGLFARRGFNIDTIVVGKTNLEGLSHIVISLNADDVTLQQLEDQLGKLIEVVKIAELGEKRSVVREHCLAKLSPPEGRRKQLLEACSARQISVISATSSSIILEKAGSPNEIDEMLRFLREYGIKELSRTGINALQKD